MSDTVSLLGKLITGPAERDCVHVAVAPVTATVRMRPGLRVGLDEEGNAEICSTKDCIGIVDPFLTEDVEPGQRFWLYLYPGTIASLRHSWTHAAFDSPPALREYLAKKYLKLGAIVVDNIGMELVIQDTSHASEGLYFGGYVKDEFSWGGGKTPKDYVRIDMTTGTFKRKEADHAARG